MRIGIFGGSFDPVHIGHLWIAEAALETLGLDQVRWIPAAQSPLKSHGPIASNTDRLQMLQLAIGGAESHIVDDREICRGEVSYTIDTVNELQSEFPDAELLMIIGSDSLAMMPKWREPVQLLNKVVASVVQRGGEPEIDFSILDNLIALDRIDVMRQSVIQMPVIELSSTELRGRVRAGQGIRFRTPRAVEAMIRAEKLYQE